MHVKHSGLQSTKNKKIQENMAPVTIIPNSTTNNKQGSELPPYYILSQPYCHSVTTLTPSTPASHPLPTLIENDKLLAPSWPHTPWPLASSSIWPPIPVVNPRQQDIHYTHCILDDTILYAVQLPTPPALTYAWVLQVETTIPPAPTAPQERTKCVYAACVCMTGKIHSDQTGTLPIASISDN